jgi:enoyl-[acyl-carrier protein] reductase III
VTSALVFGGSGGIGSSMVRRLAAAGDDVLFTYLRAESSALAVVDECADLPGRVRAVQLDVRNLAKLTEVADEAASGDLGLVFFAAASGVALPILSSKVRHWDWTFDVNVRPVIPVMQRTIDSLSKREGSIIVCTSLGSRSVMPDYGLVGAAKAALEATVRYAAVAAGPRCVRVNAVCPGVIMTKALGAFPDYVAKAEETAKRTPLGRLATCEEVAGLVAWLGGPDARMITGQTIVVDGGWELVGPLGMEGR